MMEMKMKMKERMEEWTEEQQAERKNVMEIKLMKKSRLNRTDIFTEKVERSKKAIPLEEKLKEQEAKGRVQVSVAETYKNSSMRLNYGTLSPKQRSL